MLVVAAEVCCDSAVVVVLLDVLLVVLLLVLLVVVLVVEVVVVVDGKDVVVVVVVVDGIVGQVPEFDIPLVMVRYGSGIGFFRDPSSHNLEFWIRINFFFSFFVGVPKNLGILSKFPEFF